MALVSLAKEQEREGAHILDVTSTLSVQREVDMHELLRACHEHQAALMFDSTEWRRWKPA